ncbi:MAG: tetratricopeptide repeat protein [Bacteroidia bacterium]|nr:tetratricopeptide repeat protein [Bacteroidia bacterium]
MRNLIFKLGIITLLMSFFACKGTQPTANNTPPVPPDNKGSASGLQVEQLYVEACTQLMRGDYTAAEGLFEEVLSKDPDNHAAMYNIGRLAMEKRDYSRAISYAKLAIEKESENYWYYNLLQKAYEFKGDYANSVGVQESIVKKFPQRFEDRLRLAELYLQNNETEKAINQLLSIEAQTGPNEETTLRKYQIYDRSKQYENAVMAAQTLIDINEDEPRYYQLKIEAYQKLGQTEAAIKTMEQLLEKDPDNGFALLSLAEYYKSVNQLEKSDSYLFRAFQNPEIDPEFKMTLISGLLEYVEGEPEILPRIKTLSSIFNQTHPGSAKAYSIQGKLLFLEHKIDSARVYYRKSLDIEPANTAAWMDLIETSLEEENYERLYEDSEEALDYFPNQERFLFFNGISASYTGKYAQAIRAFEKIKKTSSSDNEMMAQVYSELGKIYHQQENYADSDLNYEKAISLTPEDPYILNNYAYYLSLRGEKLTQAKTYAEKALKINPDQVSYQDTYAWILYQQGDYTEAAKWLGKATATANSPVIFEHYGDALLKLGRKDEAVEQWKRAQQKGATELNIETKLLGH